MMFFLPREHGAYGQLLVPLVAALSLFGWPRWSSGFLVVAALGLFWAHEPLLVLLGQRGKKQKREHARQAGLLFPVLLCISLFCFLLALKQQPDLLWSLALPFALCGTVVPFVFAKQEKTTLAEILVALALASWSFPVLCSKGVSTQKAWLVFVLLGFSLCVAVLSVRGLLRKVPLWVSSLSGAVFVVILFALCAYDYIPKYSYVAGVPPFFLALVLHGFRPGPRYLREVGFGIVGVVLLQVLLLSWSAR